MYVTMYMCLKFNKNPSSLTKEEKLSVPKVNLVERKKSW